jgi:hypothetical protein
MRSRLVELGIARPQRRQNPLGAPYAEPFSSAAIKKALLHKVKDAPNKYRLARSSRKRDGLARHDHAGHSRSYAQCVGVTKTPVFAEPAWGMGLRASCVVANHKAGT